MNDPQNIEPPRRRRGPECLSDPALDRLALGEAPAADAARAQVHLASCEACAARRTTLARLAESFASENNVAQLAALTLDLAEQRRAAAPAASWLSRLRWLLPMTAAVGLGAVALFALRPAGEVVTKGGLSLVPFVKRAEQQGPGTEWLGEALHPGDRLRFQVNNNKAGYLTIVAVDARAEVSVYYPNGAEAARLDAGQRLALASAVELDRTLGVEKIVAVRCSQPVSVGEVVAAARQSVTDALHHNAAATDFGPLGLPGCDETRLDITKTAEKTAGDKGP